MVGMNFTWLRILPLFALIQIHGQEHTYYIEPSARDGAPSMPDMKIHAASLQSHKNATLFFQSSSEHKNRGAKDNVAFSSADDADALSPSLIWDINNQIENKIFGGQVLITAKDGDTEVHSVSFRIRGKNPTQAQVRAFIEKNAGIHWYAWAIAQHESRQHYNVFNQFNTQMYATLTGIPNHGAPDGWGIMQLDSKRGSEITTDEVYNWQTNALSGLKLMTQARKEAVGYFNAVKRTFPDKWEEPPEAFTPQGCSTKLSALDAAVIQMYNGAAVVRRLKTPFGTYTYSRSCWAFDENAPAGQRWSFKVNNHDYVHKVIYNEVEGHIKAHD